MVVRLIFGTLFMAFGISGLIFRDKAVRDRVRGLNGPWWPFPWRPSERYVASETVFFALLCAGFGLLLLASVVF